MMHLIDPCVICDGSRQVPGGAPCPRCVPDRQAPSAQAAAAR